MDPDGRFLISLYDKESFVAWLAEHLSENGVDDMGVYMLNLAACLAGGANLVNRLPQDTYHGILRGGRICTILSLVCRAHEFLSEKNRAGELDIVKTIRKWAQRDGCLINYPRRFFRNNPDYDYFRKGGEARVYSSYESVIKTIDTSYYNNFQLLLDRIAIHDALFPESALTVSAIGYSPFKGLQVVCEQKYIKGTPCTYNELVQKMSSLGFKLVEGGHSIYEFYNDNLYVGDLNERNALADAKRNVRVIDCYARLNIPHAGYRGKWSIPTVAANGFSVGKLKEIAQRITPQRTPKVEFLQRFSTEANGLSRQILETGRYDGLVDISINGTIRQHLVSVDPNDKDLLLLLDAEIVRMMTFDIPALDKKQIQDIRIGKTILLQNIPYTFDLYKGRISPCGKSLTGIRISSVPGIDLFGDCPTARETNQRFIEEISQKRRNTTKENLKNNRTQNIKSTVHIRLTPEKQFCEKQQGQPSKGIKR